MKRLYRLIVVLAGLSVFAGIVLYGIGVVAYRTLAATGGACPAHFSAFIPSSFQQLGMDVSAYQMPDFEGVRFPSRDAAIHLSAFYVPAAVESHAAVIVAHGLAECKRSAISLLAAGMLHTAGFHVLVLDLRNMGESDHDNGLHAAGTKEYRDILAGWDWLQAQGIAPENIGLYGYSLGAASSILAAGQESQIKVVWADSSFADVQLIIDDLATTPLLQGLKPIVYLAGKLTSGDDLRSLRPLDMMPQLANRALFLVHGSSDKVIPALHSYRLFDAYQAAGGTNSTLWIAEDSEHVSAVLDYPDSYAQKLANFFGQHLLGK